MLFSSNDRYSYPDDIFADTRMSFGDHIEELRTRLIRAIAGLTVCLVIGFVLDFIGTQIGSPNFGIGKPMMKIITDPVEVQVRDFYAQRNERAEAKLAAAGTGRPLSPDELKAVNEKIARDGISVLSADEQARLFATPIEMPLVLDAKPLAAALGLPGEPAKPEVTVAARVYPAHLNYLTNRGEFLLGNKQYLKSLSAPETMVVYVKVSLLCGVVIASPWIFYQLWAFVATGLYPHERRYVYALLWPSVVLFLAGVLVCQFLVIPGAIRALLGFNQYVDVDPDLRLNEWLSFALMLPLVFGVAFQTPLVMVFLNRIGVFGWEDYWAKWRMAVMVLAVLSAVLTPTPDAVTMMYLFVPMFGLYMLGIAVCKYFPPAHEDALREEEQVAV